MEQCNGSEGVYNYRRFNLSYFDLETLQGPEVGEEALDFQATLLDGSQVHFFDYFDRPVILSTGSYTCPQYAYKIAPMNQLMQRYPNFNFLLLFGRSVHPGTRSLPYVNIQAKIDAAKLTQQSMAEHRQILIDNFEGDGHRLYGALPNSVFIFSKHRRVVYRDFWEQPKRIAEVLKGLSESDHIHTEVIDKMPQESPPKFKMLLRMLRVSGFDALLDMIKVLAFEARNAKKK